MIRIDDQFISLMKDPKVVAMYRVMIGEFQMLSLLGLPYEMSRQQQLNVVTKTTDNALSMITLKERINSLNYG